ncbi:hypothetical protein LC087_04555 [Bacillus carboniphilus]|uniref:Uncharacterized protein n=1 Tax=Bacillus carboniphilus TaxID=86663 RepID=A0ABY9JXD1_9BACI|nr:hypothetical protein [Bacillus carboniphilus]WLR43448.1 hypothetical protein LC087_04555 [Bacillus carboniphilus]
MEKYYCHHCYNFVKGEGRCHICGHYHSIPIIINVHSNSMKTHVK